MATNIVCDYPCATDYLPHDTNIASTSNNTNTEEIAINSTYNAATTYNVPTIMEFDMIYYDVGNSLLCVPSICETTTMLGLVIEPTFTIEELLSGKEINIEELDQFTLLIDSFNRLDNDQNNI